MDLTFDKTIVEDTEACHSVSNPGMQMTYEVMTLDCTLQKTDI